MLYQFIQSTPNNILIIFPWGLDTDAFGDIKDCEIDTWIYHSHVLTHWGLMIHISGLVQDCSISIANALEILQSCTNPSIYASVNWGISVSGYD